ncbi:trihelix transcription factor GTL2 isoform X2 [Cornus florida]|uniref:trihelix transcription factor GTL2 isoform X2 n=1 Tax=Cornus florida TaxID=4283 RepID=UPI00289F6D2B|nr:trihelix transcription factor GTL2 isoform X2 [Cornus florida]
MKSLLCSGSDLVWRIGSQISLGNMFQGGVSFCLFVVWSRKLAELGFKRSAEKCKEKFEEESRNFNSMGYNKNFRFFSELEELCHGENLQVLADQKNHQNTEKPNHEAEEEDKMGQSLEAEDSRTEMVENPPYNKEDDRHEKVVGKSKSSNYSKKRKRKEKFEMLKGFCEDIAKKMMAQQEELHNKLIEDMVKRDEVKIAREEAWKKQEMERIDKEIQIRAHEQAIAGERQATIIEFLKKFTSSSSTNSSLQNQSCFGTRNEVPPNTSPSLIPPLNPNYNQNKVDAETSSILQVVAHQNPSNIPNTSTSLHENLVPQNPTSQNPNSINTQSKPLTPTSSSTPKSPQNPDFTTPPSERDDIGKRWPRDEVLALINLRCNLYSTSGSEDKEGAKGTPLWERISQGMLELGYKRSAKRCKEKWENINKYFRKTKDVNKKRSMDSRTCPYFHQLSSLYSQGILVAPFDGPENRSAVQPKNHPAMPEKLPGSSQGGPSDANVHVAEGGKDVI